MGYQGVTLLLAAVIGIGFAAYQLYTQYYTPQSHGSHSRTHTYRYEPPLELPSDSSRKRRRASTTEKCSICHDDLLRDLKELACDHVFHTSCIEVWFKESRTCPVCRSSYYTAI